MIRVIVTETTTIIATVIILINIISPLCWCIFKNEIIVCMYYTKQIWIFFLLFCGFPCRPTACSWRTAPQWRCTPLCTKCRRTALLRVLVWPQVGRPHPPYTQFCTQRPHVFWCTHSQRRSCGHKYISFNVVSFHPRTWIYAKTQQSCFLVNSLLTSHFLWPQWPQEMLSWPLTAPA